MSVVGGLARRQKRHPDTITLFALVEGTSILVSGWRGEISAMWTANLHVCKPDAKSAVRALTQCVRQR
jgi:hypothetical protein